MRNISFPENLKEVPDAVIAHHEFLDGSGYPHGRSAEEIGELARMLVVADSFDAYLHGRRTPGRKPEGEDEALKYLKDNAGKLFDPAVVDLFVNQQCLYGGLDLVGRQRPGRIDQHAPFRQQGGIVAVELNSGFPRGQRRQAHTLPLHIDPQEAFVGQ